MFKDFPTEIIGLAFRHLAGNPGARERWDRTTIRDICQARLVCRRWSSLGLPYLFSTVDLEHREDNFSKWNAMLDDVTIRDTARHVIIDSAPDDLGERDYEIWTEWEDEDGRWPAFTDSIDRIRELPSINSLELRFTDKCFAPNSQPWRRGARDDMEKVGSRENTLRAVFGAIQRRASENPGFSIIRSLTIENLQNIPTPDFTTSELFRTVMKDVQELRLHITHEYNEFRPDRDLFFVERSQFEPYMEQHWLAPVAGQLTSLSLFFDECWGTLPGYFKTDLAFPNLKTLNLSNFVISHHDHFDWVLAQKSLTCLRMDQCYILSHLCVRESELLSWKTPNHDWQLQPDGSFGLSHGDRRVHTFSGTWEATLDRIRSELPQLVEFRFCNTGRIHRFKDLETMETRLHNLRYIVLDTEMLPSPWLEANRRDGAMSFGNNHPSVSQPDEDEQSGKVNVGLNMAKKHEMGDKRAFEELLQTIEKRQTRS
ncbi:hypothetical protein FZEAL_6152 [Fusarium zealandicum]|uniref:F-box domain-containing protein n=1 Tax=Fusarium zealandicum TaxID=1053134 RepID=A0A8H4XK63_9HYPO|nr:hypothetical protein FZEAL_6152 [Fusarium zealandicum]